MLKVLTNNSLMSTSKKEIIEILNRAHNAIVLYSSTLSWLTTITLPGNYRREIWKPHVKLSTTLYVTLKCKPPSQNVF